MTTEPQASAPRWSDELAQLSTERLLIGYRKMKFGYGSEFSEGVKRADAYLAEANRRDATIAAQAATIAELKAEIASLKAELAETYVECLDFAKSYGTGDEERYQARYRELTGKEHDDGE